MPQARMAFIFQMREQVRQGMTFDRQAERSHFIPPHFMLICPGDNDRQIN